MNFSIRLQFGRNVVRWRMARELTQADLVEKTGLDCCYVQRIEAGWENPNLDVIYALALALQVDWTELMPSLESGNGRPRLRALRSAVTAAAATAIFRARLPARRGSAFLRGFMEIIPIELFGVHVETPLPAPVGFTTARLEEFGAQLCDAQQGLAIRPEQLRLKKWDELFGYELVGNFFGDNGQVTRTCDRLKLFVRNARTAADWKLIVQTLERFYRILDPDEKSVTNLSAHVHAKFPSTDERETWLQQFSHNALITKPGVLGYVKLFDWEKDIRVLIEPSNVVADGIFCAWDTSFPNTQDWEEFFGGLLSMMENAVNHFELGFDPLRERV